MNKQELNNNLNFLFQPNTNVQVIVYAILNNEENPRKLDINEDDLLPIKNMFLDSITNSIINENEYSKTKSNKELFKKDRLFLNKKLKE